MKSPIKNIYEGKISEHGKTVFGYYIGATRKYAYIVEPSAVKYDRGHLSISAAHKCIPETVKRVTAGLTDHKGYEIYDGDEFRVWSKNESEGWCSFKITADSIFAAVGRMCELIYSHPPKPQKVETVYKGSGATITIINPPECSEPTATLRIYNIERLADRHKF